MGTQLDAFKDFFKRFGICFEERSAATAHYLTNVPPEADKVLSVNDTYFVFDKQEAFIGTNGFEYGGFMPCKRAE